MGKDLQKEALLTLDVDPVRPVLDFGPLGIVGE